MNKEIPGEKQTNSMGKEKPGAKNESQKEKKEKENKNENENEKQNQNENVNKNENLKNTPVITKPTAPTTIAENLPNKKWMEENEMKLNQLLKDLQKGDFNSKSVTKEILTDIQPYLCEKMEEYLDQTKSYFKNSNKNINKRKDKLPDSPFYLHLYSNYCLCISSYGYSNTEVISEKVFSKNMSLKVCMIIPFILICYTKQIKHKRTTKKYIYCFEKHNRNHPSTLIIFVFFLILCMSKNHIKKIQIKIVFVQKSTYVAIVYQINATHHYLVTKYKILCLEICEIIVLPFFMN